MANNSTRTTSSNQAVTAGEKPSFWRIVAHVSIVSVVTLLSVALFYVTIIKPDSVSMVNPEKVQDQSIVGEQILKDVAEMSPNKLLEVQDDTAKNAALSLLKDKPYDLKVLMCAGNVLCQTGEEAKGLALLKKSVYLAPESRYVRLNYARRLAAAKQYPEAIAQYQRLEQAFPSGWPLPQIELARLYMDKDDFVNAESQYRKISRDDPSNGAMLKQLGVAMACAGDTKVGYEEFLEGIATERKSAHMDPGLKEVLDRSHGDYEKAIDSLKAQISRTPKEEYFRLLLAQLQSSMGKQQGALNTLRVTRSNFDQDPTLHELFSEVFYKLDDKEASFGEFQKAVALEQKKSTDEDR